MATALALALWAAPLAAQDAGGEEVDLAEGGETGDPSAMDRDAEAEAMAAFEREMTESFAMFSDLFEVEALTEDQEARLPLAGKMAIEIMPEGTFATVMEQSMGPMMGAIMGAVTADPRIRLAEVSGVDARDLAALEDEAAQEALDIYDPNFSERTERMTGIIVDMMGRLFDTIEPSYREALARALATRFEEGEMREVLAFFATPTGAKFARESLLVQYDPQMLGVMEQMGPAMVEIMPSMIESIAALEAEVESERRFGELSAADRARAARLIGKAEAELDALQPVDAAGETANTDAAAIGRPDA
ncbi:MAG: DUF2059 domain-containing protein [Alphaproteobacteria bacterium]|nr:DUF2059 domain-containing protein [Alphaproteobacteria bacterium]